MLISVSVNETAELAVKLLGDPLRAEIVGYLAVEQLCTCHLVEMTGALQSTVSHHLRILRDAGLVDSIPAGRYTYYRLRPEPVLALRDGFERLGVAASADRRRRPCE